MLADAYSRAILPSCTFVPFVVCALVVTTKDTKEHKGNAGKLKCVVCAGIPARPCGT